MRNSIYTLLLLAALTSCKKETSEPAADESNHPISFSLDSIVLIGFNAETAAGDYWDTATNLPDPFVKVYKDLANVYTSTIAGGADNSTAYPMNTGSVGTLPITYIEGQELRIVMYDNDGGGFTDYMGAVMMEDAYNFFYEGNQEAGFTDVVVIGSSHSDAAFLLSGTFNY